MRSHTLWLVLAVTIAFTPVASRAQNGASGDNQSQGSLEQMVQDLRTDLEARGFEVAEGDFTLFTIDDCQFAIQSMGNCLGNNPAAPYVFPSVPLWPDEYVDENMRDAFGPLPNDTWATHRFDEREALVVLGRLPPPGAYFGMQTYVYSREGSINTADPIFQSVTEQLMRDILFTVSPNPSRVLTFSSIGNSNNNVVVERQSGAAFDQQRYFIITPDAVMEREMTDALVRAGVPDRNQVFTEPVSPEVVQVGLGQEADDVMTLIRYAEPENEAAGEQWRQQLPLAILRVRDTNTDRATEPYPKPAYDEKIANSELGLTGDLADLVESVKQRWGQTAAPGSPFQSLQLTLDLVGQHCLERPMNCLGDTQDADYQISPSVTMDDGEVIAVVGTLGTATDNATYTSLSVNRVAVLTGVANISDDKLEGSASPFSGTIGNTDKFYVQYFARDCTGLSNCLEITEELVPRGEVIKVIQRNYVVPGTARGANPAQILNPIAIIFDGAARPSQ